MAPEMSLYLTAEGAAEAAAHVALLHFDQRQARDARQQLARLAPDPSSRRPEQES